MTAAATFPHDGIYYVLWEEDDTEYFINEITRDHTFIFANCINHEDADAEWELTYDFDKDFQGPSPATCIYLPDYSPENYPELHI